MFDIGWSEMLLVGVIAVFAFGPEDIPKIMYNFGKVMRRFRYMRYALSSQFEDFMEKAENQTRRQADAKASPNAEPVVPEVAGEADGDAQLMEMLPISSQLRDDLPPIEHATDNDRPDPRPAPDTGPVKRDGL